jgi:hypothetical protein
MFSQSFHRTTYERVQKISVWEQLELENLKLFDPIAQEYDQDKLIQQSTHTMSKNRRGQSRKTERWRGTLPALGFTEKVQGAPTSHVDETSNSKEMLVLEAKTTGRQTENEVDARCVNRACCAATRWATMVREPACGSLRRWPGKQVAKQAERQRLAGRCTWTQRIRTGAQIQNPSKKAADLTGNRDEQREIVFRKSVRK